MKTMFQVNTRNNEVLPIKIELGNGVFKYNCQKYGNMIIIGDIQDHQIFETESEAVDWLIKFRENQTLYFEKQLEKYTNKILELKRRYFRL